MATYIVFTKEKTVDQAELEIYWQQVGATFEGHDITLLAAYGDQKVLEGPAVEGIVIAKFADQAAAMAWYDGDAYRKVREHRFKGAVFSAVLVEGV